MGVKGWSEGSIVQENGLFNDNKINKTYQNYIVGEKQDGWDTTREHTMTNWHRTANTRRL